MTATPKEQIELEINGDSCTKTPITNKPQVTTPIDAKQIHSRYIGFFCVSICIICWIAEAELEPLLTAHSFQKPYFLNYLSSSSLILMIIPYFIMLSAETLKDKFRKNRKQILNELSNINALSAKKIMNYHSFPTKPISPTFTL